MAGILETVDASARDAGASKVLKISISIGALTEVIEDALYFAFDALTEGTLSEGAELEVTTIQPRSTCLECGCEFEHDRFHMLCPQCGSFATTLSAGREMQIDSIEVDIPGEDEQEESTP